MTDEERERLRAIYNTACRLAAECLKAEEGSPADLESAWDRLFALRWNYNMDDAPRDGTPVYVQRVYNSEVIKEGWAVWGVNSPDAPMRHGDDADADYADTPRWLTLDRRFSFPTPTAWMPLPPVKD